VSGPPRRSAGPGGRRVLARAPGRVNLIGDHTDYNDGLALPMAIDLSTEVRRTFDGGDVLGVTSLGFPGRLALSLAAPGQPVGGGEPDWGRLVRALVAEVQPDRTGGGRLEITTTLPASAGLSSSAAVCVALALALGAPAEAVPLARTCQRAEARAGAEVGLMDPLVSVAGAAGSALLVDFSGPSWQPVHLPEDAGFVVVHSGVPRRLEHSPYAARRAECDRAAARLGVVLGRATPAEVERLDDAVLRRRARHVATECRRVREVAAAFAAGDLVAAGRAMQESHRSLAADFEASHPALDVLVDELGRRPGVYGARLTGGGFGGCAVALEALGALDLDRWPGRSYRVRAAGGASVGDISGHDA
jgi:galactokinase